MILGWYKFEDVMGYVIYNCINLLVLLYFTGACTKLAGSNIA
jgi:hypothetical protein